MQAFARLDPADALVVAATVARTPAVARPPSQRSDERVAVAVAQRPRQFVVQCLEHLFRDGARGRPRGGEPHVEGAPVDRIGSAFDEAVRLAAFDEPGHRLLREPGRRCELCEAQAVALKERHQDGPIGGVELAEAPVGESLGQHLVEVLPRPGQQKADVPPWSR
jgi:hypothetical protein